MIRFDGIPPEVMQAMCTPMHQVLPPSPLPNYPGAYTGALYIGSMTAVNDRDLLREHHITHLVHALDVPWIPLSERDGFNCYRIDILDQSTADIRPHLEAACNHIDKALRSGKNVLVHCQQVRYHVNLSTDHLTDLFLRCSQGVSRSSAIVIAYLIRNHGMTYDNAFTFVKRQRACIKPNSGFVRALQEWEAAWRRPAATRRFTT